ncbi:HNH endonuclease [Bremerella cremea]|uniref:HNH endonuclease n=2 Tax=Bremerella cremea TaxID=1031537 RepID=A0A368KXC2_9BACT|nr:HNH endonuclease [Bremerella cremea]
MSVARRTGSRSDGGSWNDATKLAVWQKGCVIAGYDPAVWRIDACGSFMRFSEYGTLSDYGWEIDHVKPVSKDGRDDLYNLRPLHWQNNRSKGDDWPNWRCAA